VFEEYSGLGLTSGRGNVERELEAVGVGSEFLIHY
jgi:hypothetical protein